MSHGHSHGPQPRVSPTIQRRLVISVAPFVLATLAGVVLLWPSGESSLDPEAVPPSDQFAASVVQVEQEACAGRPDVGVDFECSVVTARLEEGPDTGTEFTFQHGTGPLARRFQAGESILVAPSSQAGEESYFFVDYQRRPSLLILGAIFAVVVVALSRWHGLFSLVGVGVSIAVLVIFVIPAILQGGNPLAIAIVGAAAIMFFTLYLAHGLNARTTAAIIGTMLSLALTGLLAVVFVELARFTGFGSEEATFLQLSADQVNLQGLLLGGIIIGTLGVLDDVTITQASAVWELHAANPDYGFGNLYSAGIRIGRDHIASTVNTLVLAYAGASLPLLVLFAVSQRPIGDLINSEVVAEEVVRTLVGSIGLVASVPITTALAAAVVGSGKGTQDGKAPKGRSRARRTKKLPRHEREWRKDEPAGSEETFWDAIAQPPISPSEHPEDKPPP